MTAAALLSLWLVHLVATVSPGPAFLVGARTAMIEGFRVGAPLAVGVGAGGVFWAVAALSGLGLLLAAAPAALTALKVAGGAYLMWLAWRSWRGADEPLDLGAPVAMPRSAAGAVRLGFLTQLANPKKVVFFGAVFTGLVPPGTELAWLAAVCAIVFVNETGWFVALAFLFSRGGPRAAYARGKAWVDRAFGGLLAAVGVKVVAS